MPVHDKIQFLDQSLELIPRQKLMAAGSENDLSVQSLLQLDSAGSSHSADIQILNRP